MEKIIKVKDETSFLNLMTLLDEVTSFIKPDFKEVKVLKDTKLNENQWVKYESPGKGSIKIILEKLNNK